MSEAQIIRTEYSDVMKKSYIDYAMSVIVARALPDVRDGLKPVQRRTLYDMHELGIRWDKPYRKDVYKRQIQIYGVLAGSYMDNKQANIGTMDQTAWNIGHLQMLKGHLPENEQEIAMAVSYTHLRIYLGMVRPCYLQRKSCEWKGYLLLWR